MIKARHQWNSISIHKSTPLNCVIQIITKIYVKGKKMAKDGIARRWVRAGTGRRMKGLAANSCFFYNAVRAGSQ